CLQRFYWPTWTC
nr:immunoglobulin light chain junction region [Macaca mulatta]MOV63031.1 immunoglobulin light chain junction region [Macaca mulatta]